MVTTLSENKPSPWEIELNIIYKNINFEIDSGSDVTLIPKRLFLKNLADIPYNNTDNKLNAYRGKSINVLGKVNVMVKSKNIVIMHPCL